MKRITSKQVNVLKQSIDKMSKSKEQFIFMIFKNEDGTDNITEYSFNMVADKIKYYLKKASDRGVIRDGDTILARDVPK